MAGSLFVPLTATMLHHLPFTATIFTFLTLFIAGGVVYSLADSVWLAFVGLGLIGAGISLCVCVWGGGGGGGGDTCSTVQF